MKALLAIALVTGATAALGGLPKGADLTTDFSYARFAAVYRPELVAGSAEFQNREAVFKTELQNIVSHNTKSGSSYTKGLNQFTDMTEAEARAFRGYRIREPKNGPSASPLVYDESVDVNAAINVDWRTKNVLTPIKNQMYCGDCWAFSATESIESAAAISGSVSPVELSVGQITDCVIDNGCSGYGGCKGSIPRYGFEYIKNSTGISTAETYPFQDGAGHARSCPDRPWNKPVAAKVRGYIPAKRNSRSDALQLLHKGPLSLAVYAAQWSSYEGGVFDGCNADPTLPLDHAVQLVGAETQSDGSIVWIIRNSWSPSWGESGFIRLADTMDCKSSGPAVTNNTAILDGGADLSTCPIPNGSYQVCGPCGLLFDVTIPIASYVN